jgi:endonuclease/exonuclease/phosphatase family metal-dependent hydrolase
LYALATSSGEPVQLIDLQPTGENMAIRILSNNVRQTTPAFNSEPFQRVLRAVQPDIVSYQEVRPETWQVEDVIDFVKAELAVEPSETWYGSQNDDCATISRWPIIAATPVGGNLGCLPVEKSDRDLVIFNAHTPCCDNESGRDDEHDRISSIWRNLLNGSGPITIQPDDAMIILGDFNMVGIRRQLETLRDGLIIDNGTYGSDFKPGRLEGSLLNITCRYTHGRKIVTWCNTSSSFVPGKLDYMMFTSDAGTVIRDYTLDTSMLPATVLGATGLQAGDTDASDHLPMVVDLVLQETGVPTGMWKTLE